MGSENNQTTKKIKKALTPDGLDYFYKKIRALINNTTQSMVENIGDNSCGITETSNTELTNSIAGNVIITDFPLNLINSSLETTTTNGVTCTKNSDGTYTINGTAASDAMFTLTSNQVLTKNITYMLSGCPDDGSESTYYLGIKDSLNTNSEVYDIGDGIEYSSSSNNSHVIFIMIKSGSSVNNLVFKPMIEEGLTAHSYVPYEGYTVTVVSSDNLKSNIINITPVSVSPLYGLKSYEGGSKIICGTEITTLYPSNASGALVMDIISEIATGGIPGVIDMTSSEYEALTEDQINPDAIYFVSDD